MWRHISVKITLFYIIYYTFLTGFFIVMLQVFFKTLREDRPTWTMEDGGLIGLVWGQLSRSHIPALRFTLRHCSAAVLQYAIKPPYRLFFIWHYDNVTYREPIMRVLMQISELILWSRGLNSWCDVCSLLTRLNIVWYLVLSGSNPAMGFRPRPPDSEIESTIIWFRCAVVVVVVV